MIAVHVTHEAVEKMGGIGAVIAGLATSRPYQQAFGRTVLVGPLFQTDHPANERLGPGGKILYSSLDNIDQDDWASRFQPIERTYQVGIIYGVRQLVDGQHQQPVDVEVLLVDVFRCNPDRLNLFKGELYQRFGIPSARFEHIWEYEQYVRLAEPAYEAMHVIGCTGTPADPVVIFAHEYLGMPTALKAVLGGRTDVRTIFYAHEVASARRVTENLPGHDLMFYNVLAAGEIAGKSLEDYFPQVQDFFKHPLVKAAHYLDAVFAVGELVGREMHFLDSSWPDQPIEIVYNGLPVGRQSLQQRQAHRRRMQQYAANLLGFEPDYVFAHVARPVLSKAIWRDLGVLHELEGLLEEQGRTAVYFMLGTLAGQRRTRDILHMERVYGWPVHHQLSYPDMCNGEEVVGAACEQFNQNHKRVQAVLVNQFGWEQRICGQRMPADMSFADIRQGTDVEFGLSVYEPFGISQLEPLCFGAICAVSNVCGCLGLARRRLGAQRNFNLLEADYTQLPEPMQPWQMVGISQHFRDRIEQVENRRLARELALRLPKTQTDLADLLVSGYALGRQLDWEQVVKEFFLPAVARACGQQSPAQLGGSLTQAAG
jgi:hypothetical protein